MDITLEPCNLIRDVFLVYDKNYNLEDIFIRDKKGNIDELLEFLNLSQPEFNYVKEKCTDIAKKTDPYRIATPFACNGKAISITRHEHH